MSIDSTTARADTRTERVGRTPSWRSVLRRRPMGRLLVAHAATTVAQQLLTLAVSVHALHATGSGLWVSVTMALGYAPYAVLSGLAGTMVDRYPRGLVLAVSGAVRTVCAVALGWALLAGGPLPLVVGLATVAAIAATPAYPAVAAACAQVVEPEELPAANALATGVENVAWVAGPGAFGLVLATGQGPAAAVLVTGALFAVGAAAAGTVRLARPPSAQSDDAWHAGLMTVVRMVARQRAVRGPMTLAVLDNLLYGYLVAALLLLSGGGARLGWMNGALTVGAVLAMLPVARLAGAASLRWLTAGLALFAGCVALTGTAGATAVGVVLVLVAAVATVSVEVAAVTMLQRATLEHVHGRLLGLYDQAAVGAIALGALVAGPLAHLFGAGGAMLVVGTAGLLLALRAVVGMGEGRLALLLR